MSPRKVERRYTLADVDSLLDQGRRRIDPREFGFAVRPAPVSAERVVEENMRGVPVERLTFARSDLRGDRLKRVDSRIRDLVVTGEHAPIRAVFDPRTGDLIVAGDGNHRLFMARTRGVSSVDVVVERPASVSFQAVRSGRPVPANSRDLVALVTRTGKPQAALGEARAAIQRVVTIRGRAIDEVLKARAQAVRELRGILVSDATRAAKYRATSILTSMDDAVASWAERYGVTIERLSREAAQAGAVDALRPMGLSERLGQVAADLAPRVASSTVEGMLRVQQNLVKGVSDGMRDALRSTLHAGILMGEDPREVAQRIREDLSDLPALRNAFSRSELIARTEVLRAYSAGENEAVQEFAEEIAPLGMELTKSWLPILDDRVREAHAEMADEDPIPVSEPFTVDGELLMYPRDPNGSAGNTVNCRCSMLTLPPE